MTEITLTIRKNEMISKARRVSEQAKPRNWPTIFRAGASSWVVLPAHRVGTVIALAAM